MTKPNIDPANIKLEPMGDHAELLCPQCGASLLHHETVAVYDRGDDAEQVVRTEVYGSTTITAVVANDTSGNPSRRRDGLAIRFTCESCPDLAFDLTFAQHKGATRVAWRKSRLPTFDRPEKP